MKKAIFYIAWSILLICALAVIFSATGCKVLQHKSSKVTDSVRVIRDSITSVKEVNNSFISHIEKDTAVGIGEREVSLLFEPEEFIDTVVRNEHVNLRIYKDRHGRTHIDCKADSLTLIIARLVRDSINQSHVNDSVYVGRQQAYYSSSTLESTYKEANKGFWGIIKQYLDWLIVAIVAVLVWELFRMLRKHQQL